MNLDATIRNYVNEAVESAVKAAFDAREQVAQAEPKEISIIRGITGLANFLKVSTVTAQKLKNQKLFPYTQCGRVLIFRPEEVLAGMAKRRTKSQSRF